MGIDSYNWEDLYQKAKEYICEYIPEATVNKLRKACYGGKPAVEVSFPYKGNRKAMVILRSDSRFRILRGYNADGKRMVRGEVLFSVDGKLVN